MIDKSIAHLERYERGFGGDNAYYVIEGGKYHKQHIVVAVSWALLSHYCTRVVYGTKLVEYYDKCYVQPTEALTRLGFVVDGNVDFCAPDTFAAGNVIEYADYTA